MTAALLLSGSRVSPLAKVACFPDTANTTSNVPVDIPVLGNDVDGDQLIDESTVRITVAPNNGTATPLASGEITYRSTADFVGTATFKYIVKDTAGVDALAEATVTVTVAAPATFDAYSLDGSVDSPYTDRWVAWTGTGASVASIVGGVRVKAGVAGGGDGVAVQMWNKTLFTPDDGTTLKFRIKRKDSGLGSAPVFPAMLFYWATKGNGTTKPVDPSSWTGVTAATRWENDCFGLRFSMDPRDGTAGITGNDAQVRTRKQDDGATAGGLGEQILGTELPNTSPGQFILAQDTAYDVTMTCVGGSFDIDVTPAAATVASPFVDLDWQSKLKAFSTGQTVVTGVSVDATTGQTKCVTTAANTTFDLRDKTFRVAHIDNVSRTAKSVIRVGSTASAAGVAHAGTIITGAKVIGCGTGAHVIAGSYIWGKITWGMIKIGRKNTSPDGGTFSSGTKAWGTSGPDPAGNPWDDDGIRFQLGNANCAIECCALYLQLDAFQFESSDPALTLTVRSCYVTHALDDFEVDVGRCNSSWSDCFFDGLHSFMSNGPGNPDVTVTLNKCVFKFERQPYDYDGTFLTGGGTSGANAPSRFKGQYPNNTLETVDNILAWVCGKPWKESTDFTVVATDTIFLIESWANSGAGTMDFPPGTYTRCSLVWLGGGAYPANARGMTVYDDTQAVGQKASDGLTLYTAARDQWVAAHGGTVDANGYLDLPFTHAAALLAAPEAPVVSPRAASLASFNHPDTRYSAPIQGYLGIRAMETCDFEITNYVVSAATDPGVSTAFANEIVAVQTAPTITNCDTAQDLQNYLNTYVDGAAANRNYRVPGNHRVVLRGNIVYNLAGNITLKGAATGGPTAAKPWILCCEGDANRLKPRIGFKISMAGPFLTVWGLKFVPNAATITRTGRIALPGGNNGCKIQRCEFTGWLPDNLGATVGTNGHAIALDGTGANTLVERCYLHDPGPYSGTEKNWVPGQGSSLRIFLRQNGAWDNFQSNVTVRKCLFASTILRPKPGEYNSGQADLLEDGGNGPSYRATTVSGFLIDSCRFDGTGQGGPPIGFPGYPGTDLGGNPDVKAEGMVDLKISGTTVLGCTFINLKNRGAASNPKDMDFRFGERGTAKQNYFENAVMGMHGGKHLIVSNKFGTGASMKLFTGDAAWNSYVNGVHQYCDSATLQDNAGTVNVGDGGWNLPADRTHFRGAHTGVINLDSGHAAYPGVPAAFNVRYGNGVKETNTDFNTTRVETQLAVPTGPLGADKVGPFCD